MDDRACVASDTMSVLETSPESIITEPDISACDFTLMHFFGFASGRRIVWKKELMGGVFAPQQRLSNL